MQQKQQEQEEQMRKSYKMNKKSEQLVLERDSLHRQSQSQSRLHQPIGSIKSTTIQDIEKYSFTPQINKKSKIIV